MFAFTGGLFLINRKIDEVNTKKKKKKACKIF